MIKDKKFIAECKKRGMKVVTCSICGDEEYTHWEQHSHEDYEKEDDLKECVRSLAQRVAELTTRLQKQEKS